MSHASYHQQQNLAIPNISVVFQNVTFPSIAAWNTLSSYNYYLHGKAFRFVNSSNHPTNLLLIYESPAVTSSIDYSVLIVISIWSGGCWLAYFLGHLSTKEKKRKEGRVAFRASYSLPLFRFYGIFGLVGKQLNLAARHGNLANVEACLKRGTDVNCTDNKCYVQHFLDFCGVFFGIPLLLLFFGPHLYYNEYLSFIFPATAGIKDTPLMWAVRNGHLHIVTFLLQQGADIDRKNVSIVIGILDFFSSAFWL